MADSASPRAQTLLPAGGTPRAPGPSSTTTPVTSTARKQAGSSSSKPSKVAPNKLVRTDAQSQTLDALFPTLPSASKLRNATADPANSTDAAGADDRDADDRPSKKRKSNHDPAFAAQLAADQSTAQRSARVRIAQSECALTSVKQLRKEVLEARHQGASSSLVDSSAVRLDRDVDSLGVQVSRTSSKATSSSASPTLRRRCRRSSTAPSSISPTTPSSRTSSSHHYEQPSRWRPLADGNRSLPARSEELFYQLGLRQFGRFSRIRIKPAVHLRNTIGLAVDKASANGAREGKTTRSTAEIVEVRPARSSSAVRPLR